uniref:Uncharacterized protein n=1 Tax=Rhabditophanes sp. KR3021 TaxID=114890 RepID=A0AC35U2T3_9BILA
MWFEGYHQNLIKLVSIIVLLLLIERCKTEKIRPGHAPLWGEHRVVQLRQDQANIEARERDPEWGYFEKTDLPPWMEPAFLNRHEEDDFLVSGRVKRNAEDGNDEDSEEVMPKHFRSLKRKEIPVTYRLHRDLLQYYRKGTRPVAHPNKLISVSMSVFLYQIVKLVSLAFSI